MVFHLLKHLAELVSEPFHRNGSRLRLLRRGIDIPSGNKPVCIPDLVAEIPALFYLCLIVQNIVSCRTAQEHAKSHGIRTVFRYQIERVRRVSEGFRHFPAEFVADDAGKIDIPERYVLHEFVSGHDHSGYPEEENVRTCHQIIGRIIVCQIPVRLMVRMSRLFRIEYGYRPEP